MDKNYIDLTEEVPKLKSKYCIFIALTIRVFLQYTTLLSGIVMWYIYDYFIAIATLFLMFIIMGIIHSYLRNSVIPIHQREYQYNDKNIAEWYTAKEICYEK